ncbi:MAG: WD40 repeat domain-containing protein [Gemmataceae bacterium]
MKMPSFAAVFSVVLLGSQAVLGADQRGTKSHNPSPSPVNAIAYRPDGKTVAAGGYGEVLIFDSASGDLAGKVTGQTGHVNALTYSHDGTHLAVAGGEPAKSGEVRLYAVPPNGLPSPQAEKLLSGHKDVIFGLAFSPDGKTLASSGYDRLIKLWDVATGKEIMTLKDHSDTVYGLAFSPDGKMLASGAADRAVKIWEVATAKRLHTLSDSTDWIYALAWSPNGKHVAGGGVDKSIRIWEVSPENAKLTQSAFAHEAPVSRLVYSSDGQTLYSLGEDRVIKSWDTAKMVERKVYAKQSETTLALALRPDGKQLAVGRFDGSAALLDAATGKEQMQLLPIKPKPPKIAKITPNFGQRGDTIRLTLDGQYFEAATDITSTISGASLKLLSQERTAAKLEAEITLPATVPAAAYNLSVKSQHGDSNAINFFVDLFPQVAETELNNSPSRGQSITLPASITGDVNKAGDVDYYRFEVHAGQQIGVQVVKGATESKLDPVLTLVDDGDHTLTESNTGFLGYTFSKPGVYALGLRDRDYRGGAMTYRLHVGSIPIVTSLFPMGLQRGTEADIQVEGVFLGDIKTVHVKAAADAAPGSRLPVPITTPQGTPLGNLSIAVGEFPEAVAAGTAAGTLPTPGTANGRIDQPGSTETWRFPAKKGERLLLEVNARRLGSPLDTTIEILDAKGQPLPRAVLRCVAKTYSVFRDHDSAGAGIRIETWNDLAVNDYLYVGSELLRIFSLPRNPDDDCIFYSVNGQRQGFLGTTPSYISLGTPLYKVTINPPGATFPANGLPLVTVYYRNDDGGPGFGKDSRLVFDPPADGEYQVRIADARGQGGRDYIYRLTLRPPRPSYNLSFNPTAPTVAKGSAIPITVTAERIDEFDGPIEVKLENLPPGFSAPATTIPEGERSTSLALYAAPTAAAPQEKAPVPKLVAKAMVNGQAVVREVAGSLPKVSEPGDIVTTTDLSEVSLKPGQEARLTVKIERRNGFGGRVPVEVSGLPHGVHVLDIGLNGILITERETTRTMVIRAEPWVKPTDHPFVVFANREGKGTQHAAKSVLLKVQK